MTLKTIVKIHFHTLLVSKWIIKYFYNQYYLKPSLYWHMDYQCSLKSASKFWNIKSNMYLLALRLKLQKVPIKDVLNIQFRAKAQDLFIMKWKFHQFIPIAANYSCNPSCEKKCHPCSDNWPIAKRKTLNNDKKNLNSSLTSTVT